MKRYYELPENLAYEQFARAYISTNIVNVNYVRQFSLSGKNILYVGTEIFKLPENSIEILPLNKPKNSPTTTRSQTCYSIRLDDLQRQNNPFEVIALKINNIPYILKDAVLHTDQYGVQRLILY